MEADKNLDGRYVLVKSERHWWFILEIAKTLGYSFTGNSRHNDYPNVPYSPDLFSITNVSMSFYSSRAIRWGSYDDINNICPDDNIVWKEITTDEMIAMLPKLVTPMKLELEGITSEIRYTKGNDRINIGCNYLEVKDIPKLIDFLSKVYALNSNIVGDVITCLEWSAKGRSTGCFGIGNYDFRNIESDLALNFLLKVRGDYLLGEGK